MNSNTQPSEITIVCNPFVKIGRGSATLYLFRALKEVYLNINICDINSRLYNPNDVELNNELNGFLTQTPCVSINIYVINVDEIENTLKVLGNLPPKAYNIIYPAWELSKCPDSWRRIVSKFDEIWAPSVFVKDAFSTIFDGPIMTIPHPVEVTFTHFLNRYYFGLPDTAFLFLFFFDFSSFIDRKNPFAPIKAFSSLCNQKPFDDIKLIIKISGVNSSDKAKHDFQRLLSLIDEANLSDKIILINKYFSENEVKNLIRCCDCFLSLHRSEGFGLGLAEAMFLGKPVIATNYSGNVDYMNEENSFLVDYDLINVEEGQYPNYEGQYWADPDINQAANYMARLVDNPAEGYQKGVIASKNVRLSLSFLSVGLMAKERVSEINKIMSLLHKPIDSRFTHKFGKIIKVQTKKT